MGKSLSVETNPEMETQQLTRDSDKLASFKYHSSSCSYLPILIPWLAL